MHNALLLTRLSLKHILENLSEMEAILQLDGAKTVQQITSLESHTPSTTTSAMPTSATDSGSVDRTPAEPCAENSQAASSGVSESMLRDQAVSAPFTRVTGSDLDSLASQTAGVGGR